MVSSGTTFKRDSTALTFFPIGRRTYPSKTKRIVMKNTLIISNLLQKYEHLSIRKTIQSFLRLKGTLWSFLEKIRRAMNWFFVSLFIFLGMVLTMTILPKGWVFVAVALLISPWTSDLIKKYFGIKFTYSDKIIIVLFGIVILVTSIIRSDDEQIRLIIASIFLSQESDEQFNAFLKMQQENENVSAKKKGFLEIRSKQIVQLETLFKSGNYPEVVRQGLPYVGLDNKIKNLVESASEKIEQAQFDQALRLAPGLIKEGKFVEAYSLVGKLDKMVKKELDEGKTAFWEYGLNEFLSSMVNEGQNTPDLELGMSQTKRLIKQSRELMEQGKFRDAHYVASKIQNVPELEDIAKQAKAKLEEEVAKLNTIKDLIELTKTKREEELSKLRSLYEKGKYENLIAMGMPYSEFDCKIKQLVSAAEKAQVRKTELEQVKKALKEVDKLLKDHQFRRAYEIAKDFKEPDLQELAHQAKNELDRMTEKKILAKLQKLPSHQVEQIFEEYAKLVALFPENNEYKGKLAYYRKRLTQEHKIHLITQEQYGEKWPFTIAQAKLDCTASGVVTVWVNEKTYAMDDASHPQGYSKIGEILKGGADPLPIFNKGRSLCKDNTEN